jgi:hypothetical protein
MNRNFAASLRLLRARAVVGVARFKDTRRGGWQWHQTKMVDPRRAERLWLAIAVATLWAVSVGGEADATLPVSSLEALPELHVARRKATGRSRPRMISCFARGLLLIVGTLIRGDGLLLGRFVPEPWPYVRWIGPEVGNPATHTMACEAPVALRSQKQTI